MFSHFLRKLGTLGSATADVRTVRAAGVKWRLTHEAAELFGPGPDLDCWIKDGSASVVKTGPHRTVYHVVLPGGTIYVKRCRINGSRAWAREVLRPPKARLEFENALALAERGIAAATPLAWGSTDSRWPGESYLITRSLDSATPFLALMEDVLPTLPPREQAALRRQLAHDLGQFLARMHDTGVAHPDPHPGNLLVELPASRVPRFALLDLHAVRLGRPLGWAESRANLVLFNRWFHLRASRADRLRFWHAYRRGRTALRSPTEARFAAEAREVERDTAASNLHFWAGRVSRCRGSNRYFRKLKAGSLRGFAVRDLPDAAVAELLADPDALFTRSGVKLLKDSRTSTVAEVMLPMPDGPRAVILKRVNVRRWWEPAKNLFRPSAVLRSWVNGHALRDRWLPTPRPLAMLHRVRRGLPAEGYLLVEKVPAVMGLSEASLTRTSLHRLARTLRDMHDRGVSHRDLKAANILLSHDAPSLIDLVGVRLGRSVPFRLRVKELARLNASFLHSSTVTHSDRLRFLRAYLAAGSNLERDWRNWWIAVSRATEVKVAKNERSGRPLA